MANELAALTEFTGNLFRHAYFCLPWLCRNSRDYLYEVNDYENVITVLECLKKNRPMFFGPEKQLAAASKEGQEVITRAARTGEDVRQKAQQEARQDTESLIARARVEIQRGRDEAIDELRKEVADLTILAAGKVIDQTLDKQAHRQLIEKVLEESKSLKKG